MYSQGRHLKGGHHLRNLFMLQRHLRCILVIYPFQGDPIDALVQGVVTIKNRKIWSRQCIKVSTTMKLIMVP